MCEGNLEIVEIQVDSELLKQLTEIISPTGLTPEMLIRMFFEWWQAPEALYDFMRDECQAEKFA